MLLQLRPKNQKLEPSLKADFTKSALSRLRTFAASTLLQGWIFHVWVGWKTGKLVALYKRLLVQTSRSTVKLDSPRAVAPREPLQKLLLIADAMWEKRELLPELSRICAVTFVDVHPHIKADAATAEECLPAEHITRQLDAFRKEPYDCMLVYLRSSLLSKELIGFLRTNWSCPLLGLNMDCKTTFEDYKVFRRDPDGYRHWAHVFDCNLTNAKIMSDVYAAAGFNCLYVPTGYHFDPAIHKLRKDADFEIGISFVGSCKPERKQIVEHLKGLGIDVELFGGGWAGQGFVKDGWQIYQKSQLNLGIGYNVPDMRFTNLKNRDFECPGAGGCYLTTFDWELADLFEIGKEILCYRSIDELPELYTYYIRRPQDCLRIAAAGFDRCRRDHTWEQRFRKVFSKLGFDVPTNSSSAEVGCR